MMRTLLAGLAALGLATPAAAVDTSALHAALASGDSAAMGALVAEIYGETGASLSQTLTWSFEPYDIIVNHYAVESDVIHLGALPRPAEVGDYWRNWSAALTAGRFAPQTFFADETEAAALAGYNQLVLALHEYGHAITYRYDPDHVGRHGDKSNVNCREWYADRLAASAIRDLSVADPAFAALESRYVRLMAAFNAAIAPAHRYAIASLETLVSDCASIHVDQPTEASMAPYASAFFERQRLLLTAGPPPLVEAFARHLESRRLERQAPPSGRAGPVETLTVQIPAEPADALQYLLLAPAGVFRLEVQIEQPTIAYGPLAGPLETIPLPRDLLTVDSGVAIGADRFVLVVTDFAGDLTQRLLLDVRRIDGKWVITEGPDTVVADYGFLLHDPDGDLYVFADEADGYRQINLDSDTLAILGETRHPRLAYPVAIGAGGAIFTYDSGSIQLVQAGETRTFAGSGLIGLRDSSNPLLAEFRRVTTAFATCDGSLLVVDRDWDRQHVLRVVHTAAPAQ